MRKAEKIKKFLDENKIISLDYIAHDNKNSSLFGPISTENGFNGKIWVAFNEDNSRFQVQIFDFCKVSNDQMKQYQFLKWINEKNDKFNGKFILSADNQVLYQLDGNFLDNIELNTDIVVLTMQIALNVTSDNYPELMKLQWS